MAVHYSDSELDPMSPCTLDEAAREQCSSDEDPAELGEPGWLGLSVEPRSHDDDDCNDGHSDNESNWDQAASEPASPSPYIDDGEYSQPADDSCSQADEYDSAHQESADDDEEYDSADQESADEEEDGQSNCSSHEGDDFEDINEEQYQQQLQKQLYGDTHLSEGALYY